MIRTLPPKSRMRHTHVVEDILSTNVEQSTREIGICHLHRVVQGPESSTERVAYAREAPTRSGIGFEHQHPFPFRLGKRRRVEVRLNNRSSRRVSKKTGEQQLRVLRCADPELREAVVCRIAKTGIISARATFRNEQIITHCSTARYARLFEKVSTKPVSQIISGVQSPDATLGPMRIC